MNYNYISLIILAFQFSFVHAGYSQTDSIVNLKFIFVKNDRVLKDNEFEVDIWREGMYNSRMKAHYKSCYLRFDINEVYNFIKQPVLDSNIKSNCNGVNWKEANSGQFCIGFKAYNKNSLDSCSYYSFKIEIPDLVNFRFNRPRPYVVYLWDFFNSNSVHKKIFLSANRDDIHFENTKEKITYRYYIDYPYSYMFYYPDVPVHLTDSSYISSYSVKSPHNGCSKLDNKRFNILHPFGTLWLNDKRKRSYYK